METFAALKSPSMVEIPPKQVIFGRSSTRSTVQRSVEEAANANMPLLLQSENRTVRKFRPASSFVSLDGRTGIVLTSVALRSRALCSEANSSAMGRELSPRPRRRSQHVRGCFCGHVDESIGNLSWLDSVS